MKVENKLAHKLGAFHYVPHGIANALLIDEVIGFNATDAPRKQAAFPQYKYPNAGWRYARIADYLNLEGNTEEKFYTSMDKMVEQAFDDQYTGANPIYPLISEIKEMYIKSYN